MADATLESTAACITGLVDDYPGASANGASLTTSLTRKRSKYFGTSLAASVWALIIALINMERARAGEGTTGFVHPVLHQHAGVLQDITTGTTSSCGTNAFSAGYRWDPASDLGTPNYPALLGVFLNLP